MEPPVRLDADETDAPERRGAALSAFLAPHGLGPVEWVAETGSTNADLLAAAAEGHASGVVRITDHQTAGRGRLDRTWHTAPDAALLLSVLVRLPADGHALARATVALGVAACEAVRSLGFPMVGLKWPNDLVVDAPGQPKLAGVLAQSAIADHDAVVVVGLGCNVRDDGLAELVPARAAAALSQYGRPPDRVRLAAEVLRRFDPGAADLWERYRSLSLTIGTEVVVETVRGVITGRAMDVTDLGALLIDDDADGVEVMAGDVTSARHSNPPTRE